MNIISSTFTFNKPLLVGGDLQGFTIIKIAQTIFKHMTADIIHMYPHVTGRSSTHVRCCITKSGAHVVISKTTWLASESPNSNSKNSTFFWAAQASSPCLSRKQENGGFQQNSPFGKPLMLTLGPMDAIESN